MTLPPPPQNSLGMPEVGDYVVGSGGLIMPLLVANQYQAVTLNSASGTTSQLLVTGNPGYYFQGYGFQCDLNATVASAGMVNITFADSASGNVAVFRLWVPASAASPATPSIIREVDAPQSFWNNKTANSTLSVSLNTALTAGSIRCFVRYGLCNFVG
jgi:hypothetical protein